jgi:hypothetical protein
VRSELRCNEARVEASARLDEEIDERTELALDEHLSECAACRAHEQSLRQVRSALRVRPADEAPDLAPEIMERVRADGGRARRRDEWLERVRIASIAAAAAALVLLGVSAPWQDDPSGVAEAVQIQRKVREAARSLETYRATFSISERGWHPAVDVRRFQAKLWFNAPERFKLELRDLTTYPTPDWPRTDVDVIAAPGWWWSREPSLCPVEALPGCEVTSSGSTRVVEAVEQTHAVDRRAPFDATRPVGTDIVVPLETIASSDGLTVLGTDQILGRDAYRVTLPYAQALPLVQSLLAEGSWRSFYPLDRVEMWIDSQTLFPLRFKVIASSSQDRNEWSAIEGVSDRPGEILLSVRATSLAEPDEMAAGTFDSPPGRSAAATGGFAARSFEDIAADGAPRFVAGLKPYRAGVTDSGHEVLAYANGTTWLKVTRGDASFVRSSLATAEEVRLADGGFGYYLPADKSLRRSLDMVSGDMGIRIESNLARAELLRAAASLPLRGQRAPETMDRPGGLTIRRLSLGDVAALKWAEIPGALPRGYRPEAPSAVLLSSSRGGGRTLTLDYRRAEAEYDGLGIRIAQAPSVDALPPSPEASVHVRMGRRVGRWSPESGELEWIDAGTYRAIAAPSLDLPRIIGIARGLR